MTEASSSPESVVKHSNQDRLAQAVCPIWTPERGKRLRMMRMKMMKDQSELGALIGMTQQNISVIESGRNCRVQVPLSKWKAILGVHFNYVLFGLSGEKYAMNHIRSKYWAEKNSRPKKKREQT